MSCPQDSAYTIPFVPPGNSCGAGGGLYTNCYGGPHSVNFEPTCCPANSTTTGGQKSCGEAKYAWECLWNPPDPSQFDNTAKVNCCLNQNLPNSSPIGYCATGWCPNSSACQSFMTTHCQKANLNTDECKQFCRNNTGKCDVALTSYCADPNNFTLGVCGCALPTNQYPLSTLQTPDGLQIPITCDKRCDVNVDAIRLQGQQDCKIGAICVVDLTDVNIYNKYAKTGIVIDQNCGNTGPTNNFWEQYKWLIFAIFIIILLILAIVIVLVMEKD